MSRWERTMTLITPKVLQGLDLVTSESSKEWNKIYSVFPNLCTSKDLVTTDNRKPRRAITTLITRPNIGIVKMELQQVEIPMGLPTSQCLEHTEFYNANKSGAHQDSPTSLCLDHIWVLRCQQVEIPIGILNFSMDRTYIFLRRQ